MKLRRALCAVAIASTLVAAEAATAAEGDRVSRPGVYRGYTEAIYDGHEMTSRYVEVRDGTRLAMDLFRPTSGGEVVEDPLPVLWMHTPYNRRFFRGDLAAERYPGQALKLVPYGYVVAVVDFRGLYASFGRNGAYNRGEWLDAARWDAYDVTEWLAAQSWSSGEIGMWGCSATGGSQMQAATTAPPHLKAIFPMSCEFDVYPFAVAGGMAPPEGTASRLRRGGSREARDRSAVPVDADTDRALLEAAIAEHADNVDSAGYVPFRDSVSETLGKPWWLASSPHTYADQIERSGIALYLAVNWDEGGTKHGSFFSFNNLDNPRKLIVGPDTHCNWAGVLESEGFDLIVEERRFFDHWLKGIDNGVMDEPPVYYYTYNAPSGKEWRFASQWPLPEEKRTRLYLGASPSGRSGEGALVATTPSDRDATDVVTVAYDVTGENRAEKGLTYVTPPLEAPLQITGHPLVHLWVSSTATDGDFLAHLEDLAPDGTARSYFMEGRLRASLRALHDPPYDHLGLPWHRSHEADAQPLEPGVPVELVFDLYPISYVFPAGHQIRLTLSFADARATPRLDPPPVVTVHRDAARASYLELPVIESEGGDR